MQNYSSKASALFSVAPALRPAFTVKRILFHFDSDLQLEEQHRAGVR